MVYCRYWIVENRRQNVLELAIAYLLMRWESRKSSISLASNSAYPIFSKHWCDNSSHYCWLGFQHFRTGISSHERVQYCARSGNHPTTCSIIRLLRLTVGRRIYRRWPAQKSELIAKVYQPEKDLLKFIRCLKLFSLTCPTWTCWRIPIISASEMITAASQHSLCPGANHQWSWWHHRSQARGETLGYQWIILEQKIKIGGSGCCGFGECGYGWYDEWSSLKFLTCWLDVRKTCMGWARIPLRSIQSNGQGADLMAI